MRWRDDEGQALVEFALVVVLFLMLLGGVIDVGRVAGTYFMMANGAREGARIGILGKSDTEIVAAVNNATDLLDPATLTVSVEPPEADRDRGTPLKVSVAYEVDLLLPFSGALFSDPFPLQAATTMRME